MLLNSEPVHHADPRGYLREPMRLFHLNNCESESIPYHYHEFHKIILFLSGTLSYRVEGRSYALAPEDLLLIPAHAIHQPIIGTESYERIILWMRPEPLAEQGLDDCFRRCREENRFLLHRNQYDKAHLLPLLQELERCRTDDHFGADLLAQSFFLQLMVYLNRSVQRHFCGELPEEAARSDPKIDEILAYINADLTRDLSVNALSARFYLSRSWLMHRFKSITGCPIHQYVLQKRLILASQLLRGGESVSNAARQSGFSDYSAFLRSFRKAYGISPREFQQ